MCVCVCVCVCARARVCACMRVCVGGGGRVGGGGGLVGGLISVLVYFPEVIGRVRKGVSAPSCCSACGRLWSYILVLPFI